MSEFLPIIGTHHKPMIYVAGPYSAETQERVNVNVALARSAAQIIWDVGGVAICPHLNTFGFEQDGSMDVGSEAWREDFETFLTGDFEIISRCDAVLFIAGWEGSKGAVAEFAFASYIGVTCLFHWTEIVNYIQEY